MVHSFDIDVAQKIGLEESIILNNLIFWITKNRENNKNYHDGFFWTYNSLSALKKLFPYFSVSKIRRAINNLETKGIIKTGNYNKSQYDRTKWFAIINPEYFDNCICENNESICENNESICENNESICENNKSICENNKSICENNKSICEKHTTIPYNKPDSNTDTITDIITDNIQEKFLECSLFLKSKIIDQKSNAIIKDHHLKEWAKTFRLMVERDGRTLEQIKSKIVDVFNNEFWSKQIRSAGKLRQKLNEGRLDNLNNNNYKYGHQNLKIKDLWQEQKDVELI